MFDSAGNGVERFEAPQPDAPNAKYRPGMLVESVGAAIVREEEDLESLQVTRLLAKTRVEVLSIGVGPSGKRIQVRAVEQDVEGWVSVIAQNKAPLWREVTGAALNATRAEEKSTDDVDAADRRRRGEEERRKEEAERRSRAEEEKRKEAAKEAEKQRKLEEDKAWTRRDEEEKRKEAAEEAEKQRKLAEDKAREEEKKPTDGFGIGDVWMCTSSLCLRSEEDLANVGSEVVGRLDSGREVEVLGIGTGPTGKRVRVRCEKDGLEGWVSVVNPEGKELLSLVRRKGEPFKGAGHALGGSGGAAADPRAAALAAAERRQKGAFAHGLGEKKAKELSEQGKRDALLKKVSEVYAKRQEEVPMSLQSASLDALQRHLDHLLAPPEAAPKPRAAAAASSAQAAPRFEPPARGGAGAALHPAAVKVLDDMKANPGLDMLQEMVAKRPLTLQFTVQDFLKEHASAASLEPRLKGEIEKLLCRGQAPPQVEPSPPQVPQAPPSPEEQRRLLMEEARTVCGLSAKQLQSVEELEALGFDYRSALEAFLACERNKELAANYLFENPPAVGPQAPAQLPAFVGKSLPPAFPGKPPREEDLSLSMDDMEAIQRIQELGFDRPTSLKAYVACGRDEEAASNRLLH